MTNLLRIILGSIAIYAVTATSLFLNCLVDLYYNPNIVDSPEVNIVEVCTKRHILFPFGYFLP